MDNDALRAYQALSSFDRLVQIGKQLRESYWAEYLLGHRRDFAAVASSALADTLFV